jgi:hypothetical protein
MNDSLLVVSASGRAYRDQGSGFQVVVNGSTIAVGGTSASSPVRQSSLT